MPSDKPLDKPFRVRWWALCLGLYFVSAYVLPLPNGKPDWDNSLMLIGALTQMWAMVKLLTAAWKMTGVRSKSAPKPTS